MGGLGDGEGVGGQDGDDHALISVRGTERFRRDLDQFWNGFHANNQGFKNTH